MKREEQTRVLDYVFNKEFWTHQIVVKCVHICSTFLVPYLATCFWMDIKGKMLLKVEMLLSRRAGLLPIFLSLKTVYYQLR